jgi:hypothetical protein
LCHIVDFIFGQLHGTFPDSEYGGRAITQIRCLFVLGKYRNRRMDTLKGK